MKWVKVAIGAVIAIAVVPMIALSVFNLTQEQTKEEVVTFEILTETTITSGVYDELLNLTPTLDIFNLDLYVNNILIDTAYIDNINSEPNTFILYIDNIGESLIIYNDDTILIADYDFQVGDIVKLVEEVTIPPVLNGVTATLLLLAPLIFVSGILYFIYNNKQEGI